MSWIARVKELYNPTLVLARCAFRSLTRNVQLSQRTHYSTRYRDEYKSIGKVVEKENNATLDGGSFRYVGQDMGGERRKEGPDLRMVL